MRQRTFLISIFGLLTRKPIHLRRHIRPMLSLYIDRLYFLFLSFSFLNKKKNGSQRRKTMSHCFIRISSLCELSLFDLECFFSFSLSLSVSWAPHPVTHNTKLFFPVFSLSFFFCFLVFALHYSATGSQRLAREARARDTFKLRRLAQWFPLLFISFRPIFYYYYYPHGPLG